VIAGVLKRQIDETAAIGADRIIATDDQSAMDNLPPLDAVADAVGGKTAETLISKVSLVACLHRCSEPLRMPRSTHR